MSLAFQDGPPVPLRCRRCDLSVPHAPMVIFEGAKERRYFLGTKHTAPCGLPCLGGGVASNEPGMKDRPRRVHGWIGGAGTDQCPACAAMTPPPAGPSVGEEDEWRRGEHEVEATPPVDTSTK